MGSLYRKKWRTANGTVKTTPVWWIKYYKDGKPIRESSESEKESDARKLLKLREGDVVKGIPVTPRLSRITFQELADDEINDYKVNHKKSISDLERRLNKHVLPVFAARRASSITTADIRRFVVDRQKDGASNGEINRELTAIKRAFTLGAQAAKILVTPHIPMLKESNARKGFFEREEFDAVYSAHPDYLKPVLTFSYTTGWRIPSEVLNITIPQVDLINGEVRLDPGTTKNSDGRVFPLTAELTVLLERLIAETRRLQREKGIVCPWVFNNNGKRICSFYKAWARACYKAGLPCVVHFKRDSSGEIRTYKQGAEKGQPIIDKIDAQNIPHDFRRTAVRNLVRAGIPERVAMQMTGHKTRSVFERYNIVSKTDLRDAARRLENFTGTNTGTNDSSRASLPTERSANLLHFNDGPVAQLDRAAVS
jgi:integrase